MGPLGPVSGELSTSSNGDTWAASANTSVVTDHVDALGGIVSFKDCNKYGLRVSTYVKVGKHQGIERRVLSSDGGLATSHVGFPSISSVRS